MAAKQNSCPGFADKEAFYMLNPSRSGHLRRKLTAGLLAAALSVCSLSAAMPLNASAASDAETFLARAVAAWENGIEKVSMNGLRLTVQEVTDLYYGKLYQDSDWTYVLPAFNYTVSNMTGYVASLTPRYKYITAGDRNSIKEVRQRLKDAVDGVVSQLRDDWSDAEKVLFLHDYVITHCVYDTTLKNVDAYSVFGENLSICQGYAMATNLLCRAAGFPCWAIASNSLQHMWNVVQIGGKWYQLDTTYDDLSPDMLGQASHTYLLVSDDYMMNDENHAASDWIYFTDSGEIACDSDIYESAFWQGAGDAVTPMPDGTWIYAKANDSKKVNKTSDIYADLQRADMNGNVTDLYRIYATWPTPTGKTYTNCYTTAEVWDGRIYYTTKNEIRSVKLDGSDSQLLHKLSADELDAGYLYGMAIDQKTGVLTYQLQKAPEYEDSDLNISVKFIDHQLELPPAEVTTTEPEPETTTVITTTLPDEPETTTVTTTVPDEPETTVPATTTVPDEPETTVPATTTVPDEPETTIVTTTLQDEPDTTPAPADTTGAKTEETVPVIPPESTEPFAETTTTAEDITSQELPPPKYGDVDGSGEINIADAVLLARYNAEDPEAHMTAAGLRNADCNGDGKVNSEDLTWILLYLVGLTG